MKASGPLYLAPLRKEHDWSKAEVWFVRDALGVNSIAKLMETIATKSGLDITSKRFTNYSLNKTSHKIMQIRYNKQADYDIIDLDITTIWAELLEQFPAAMI